MHTSRALATTAQSDHTIPKADQWGELHERVLRSSYMRNLRHLRQLMHPAVFVSFRARHYFVGATINVARLLNRQFPIIAFRALIDDSTTSSVENG